MMLFLQEIWNVGKIKEGQPQQWTRANYSSRYWSFICYHSESQEKINWIVMILKITLNISVVCEYFQSECFTPASCLHLTILDVSNWNENETRTKTYFFRKEFPYRRCVSSSPPLHGKNQRRNRTHGRSEYSPSYTSLNAT